MKHKGMLILILIAVIYSTTYVLIIPPIGAMPEGRTIWMLKPNRLFIAGRIDFLETPDHFQYKNTGKVSIFGRAITLSTMMKSSTIIIRLPYINVLEVIANGGLKWEEK